MLANLKLALHRRGLRQEDVAQLLGVSPSLVCRIIGGGRQPGRLRTRLAVLLGVKEDWLFAEPRLPV